MSFFLSFIGLGQSPKKSKISKSKSKSVSSKPQHITIWTIEGCKWCLKLKKYLNKKNIHYEERTIGKGWTSQQFQKATKGESGVPQVFIGKKHIGGYNEALELL